jgi:formylglycine-generating enzyme required for sulfatase activity
MRPHFSLTLRFDTLRSVAVCSLLALLGLFTCMAYASEPSSKVLRDCAGCPEVVVLAAGSFRMGSPAQEADRDRDEALRLGVRIAAFAIGRYEVTVAQYLACVQANACTAPAWQADRTLFSALGESVQAGNHPIVGVSWQQAQSYVQWLSRITGKKYYLPSETQWEYAARAGSISPWSFGNSVAQAGQYAWFEDNSGTALHPVGGLRPNAWGLYDMHGSVWEWVQDCYEVWGFYEPFDPRYGKAPHDDKAWQSGVCNNRVARGGSWSDGAARLRSASRYYNSALHATSVVGFRVARALPTVH